MSTENLFFVIGPLRTGSSLMSRCIDDHPESICLCESEVNRALIHNYALTLHFNRMRQHGLPPHEIISLLNLRKQDSIDSLIGWYQESQDCIAELYNKRQVNAFGDKSPDFFISPEIVRCFADRYRLIYTVRDPRAIYHSIMSQTDSTAREKQVRWDNLTNNFLAWEPWLDNCNILTVKYEDLILHPEEMMSQVYRHIGLNPSQRFLEPFERLYPKRFLWKTAIDWESGIRRQFDPNRINRWENHLNEEQLQAIHEHQHVKRFMSRFSYGQ